MKVFLSNEATDYIRSEHAYLETYNPRAANDVIKNLRAAFRRIAAYPQIGSAVPVLPGRRHYVVGAYIISYRIEGDAIQILHIRHGRQQDPELERDDPIDDA